MEMQMKMQKQMQREKKRDRKLAPRALRLQQPQNPCITVKATEHSTSTHKPAKPKDRHAGSCLHFENVTAWRLARDLLHT